MNDVRVQPLTSADAARAYQIEQQAHLFPWAWSVFQRSLQAPCQGWGLWQDHNLFAIAFFQLVPPELELLNLAVAPAYQGRGFGRYFLDTLLTHYHQQGMDRCFLEVRASNTAAIALYERLGFNQLSIRPGYYPLASGREDAYVYAVELSVW